MRTESEALSVERVSVSFPGRSVLKDVSFAVKPGEFCGLVGANGSGKTTLLKSILGFVKPQHGTVRLGASGSRAIGYVPQKILLDSYMPLRTRDLVALGFDGGRFGLPLPSADRRHRVDEMLAAVDATQFANRRVGNLSGGQQQRVLIAHALIREPSLLLLDEPLANLDLRSTAEIVRLLRRIATEHQISILLSAHDMNPLLSAMDRIVYLANGNAATGPVKDVVRTEVLSRLYGYHIDVIRVHNRILVVAAEPEGEMRAGISPAPPHVVEIP
ncbi:MAG: ABC transporter ATP-binding protein [Pseudolabrys sp.]